jgi:predicted RNase H-like HicB family nuclease
MGESGEQPVVPGRVRIERKSMPRYTVIVEWDEEGGCWVGCVPALNWLADQGATQEELRERIREAATGYLELLQELGEPIPEGDPPRPAHPTLAAGAGTC